MHGSDDCRCIRLQNKTWYPFASARSLLIAIIFFLAWSDTQGQGSQASANNLLKLTQQAQAAIASQHWGAAAASYEQAIRLAPNNASLRVDLGAALARLG